MKEVKNKSKKYEAIQPDEKLQKDRIKVKITEEEEVKETREVNLMALNGSLENVKEAIKYHQDKIKELKKFEKNIKKERKEVLEALKKVDKNKILTEKEIKEMKEKVKAKKKVKKSK